MFPQTSEWLYELAFRESDGIEVALLWDGVADRVLVNVRDVRTGEWFVCAVDHAHALEAFRHPFALRAAAKRRHPAPTSRHGTTRAEEADDAPPRP